MDVGCSEYIFELIAPQRGSAKRGACLPILARPEELTYQVNRTAP